VNFVSLESRIENIKLYLKMKWLVVLIIFLVNIFEGVGGLTSLAQGLIVYTGLLIVSLFGFLLHLQIKKKKSIRLITHLSLIFDILVIILTLYFHGGIQNSWLFLPTFVIFLSSFVFGFSAGVFYSAFSFLVIIIMAIIQYRGIVPSFPLFNLPEQHWRNTQYIVDYLAGMGVLYFTSALSIGLLNRLAAQRMKSVNDSRQKIEQINTNESEEKEKIRKSKVEILVRNAELERLQVFSAERQLELISLKKELEELKKKR